MNATRPAKTPPYVDVAVVGAGPAGLAAAVAAAAEGAAVAVVDAAEQPGGQYWRHRSETANSDDDGSFHHDWHEYLTLRAAFDSGIAAGQIHYLPATSVWFTRQLAKGPFALELARSYGPGPALFPSLRASRLVVATGAYDRQIPVAGWDLPGVMTAGGIQAFVKQNGTLPGSRFVIAGTGPFLLPVAASITQAGGTVAAVCESANLTGWIPRAHRAAAVPAKAVEGLGYATAFLRSRIPYRPQTVVTEILGSGRVEAVRTSRIDQHGGTVAGTSRLIEGIDSVGLGWGFTPQLELAVQLGASTRVDVDGSLVAVVDASGRSTVGGLFLAGEVSGVGGASLAVLEGRIAGRTAGAEACGAQATPVLSAEARAIRRQRRFAEAMHRVHAVPRGWQERVSDDTLVCRCEEVRAGSVRRARTSLAAEDLRAQKGVTRAGMGWCQGRVCGYAVACLAGSDPDPAPGSDPEHTQQAALHRSLLTSAKRPIAQPIPLGELRKLGDDTIETAPLG